MKKLLLLFILILNLTRVGAQNSRFFLSEDWISESGSQNFFIECYTTTDGSGNSYVVGATVNSYGNYDILVSKFDNSGNLDWSYQKDGDAGLHDVGSHIYVDDSLNVFVTGGVTNSSGDSMDIFLAKLDENGNELWDYSRSGLQSTVDMGTKIFPGSSTDIFLIGAINENFFDKTDVYLARFSTSGGQEWENVHDFTNTDDGAFDGFYDDMTGDCNVYSISNVSAGLWGTNYALFDGVSGILGTNTFTSMWYQGNMVTIEDVYRDGNNSIYFTGMAIDSITGSRDVFVSKDNSWKISIDGGDSVEDFGKSIVVDDSGYIYVAANVRTVYQGSDFLTIKIDPSGNVIWTNRSAALGNGDDLVKSIVVNDSGFVMTSGSSLNDSNDFDFFNICYDKNGSMVWTATFDNGFSGDDKILASVLNNNDLIVTGQSEDSIGYVYKTIKYEHLFLKNQIIGKTDSTSGHVNGELILFFNDEALSSSKVNFDNHNKTFGTLSDYLSTSATNAMKAKIDTADINLGSWKAYRLLPHWSSNDTLSVTRFGDTVEIPPFYSSLVLIIPDGYIDTIILDSLTTLHSYISSTGLNVTLELSGMPNDPLLNEQLYLSSSNDNVKIDINGAWDYSVGDPNIKVGIIDSGINWAHDDLTEDFTKRKTFNLSRVKGGKCYSCSNKADIKTVDPDKNDEGSPSPNATRGHGTCVAGIIGAIRNNSIGVAGIAGGDYANPNGPKGVSLYDLKQGTTTFLSSNTIAAVLDAATKVPGNTADPNEKPGFGLDIINCSFQYPKNPQIFSEREQIIMAFGYAYQQGCIIVFASANHDTDAMLATEIPGRLPDEWSLLTGGSDENGLRATDGLPNSANPKTVFGSNLSPRLDFIAPFRETLLYSTFRNSLPADGSSPGKYGREGSSPTEILTGTSFSAPQVTGVASLMLSYMKTNNSLKLASEDIENIMQLSAKKTFSSIGNWTNEEGYGLIKATKSLQNIDIRDKRIIHINSDGSGNASSISNYLSVPGSPTASDQQLNLVKLADENAIMAGENGIYTGDIYRITDSIVFTIPEQLHGVNQWERHSFAEGLKSSSDIFNEPGAINLYYHSETYNGFTAPIKWTSSTTGTAYLESYFYFVKRKGFGAGSTDVSDFWVPFDPNNQVPKFGFTIYGSAWPLSVDEYNNPINSSRSLLYPNPTKNEAWIELANGLKDKEVKISLYSVDGRLIAADIYQLNGNDNKFKVNTSNLNVGLYFAVVHCESFMETHKLIIKD